MEPTTLDLANGIAAPLGSNLSLLEAESQGLLYGPAVNKVTVLGFRHQPLCERSSGSTPWRLTPLFPTNCGTKWSTKDCGYCAGTEQWSADWTGGQVLRTYDSGCALTNPGLQLQAPEHFNWPLVPHPPMWEQTRPSQRYKRRFGGRRTRQCSRYRLSLSGAHGKVIPKGPGRNRALRVETGVPGY